MDFKIVKKGYDKLQVIEYLDNLQEDNKSKVEALKKEIDEKQNKIECLEAEIAKIRQKRDNLEKVIEIAEEKALDIEYSAKIKYAVESEILEFIKNIWEKYIKEDINKLDETLFKEIDDYFAKMNREIDDSLKKYYLI